MTHVAAPSAGEVLVAGTGPAGLAAALLLHSKGFDVTLAGPEPVLDDQRTTALMVPALDLLDSLGVLEAVLAQSAPLRAMRIVDATSRLVRASTVTFHASEIGRPHFGLNIPNTVLTAALADAVARAPIARHVARIERWETGAQEVVAHLEGGADLRASLAVAADGRNSAARAATGIASLSRSHDQTALALTFGHTRPHGFVSTELHTESGPFTQVPLPGDRSSLVWVVSPKEAAVLLGLGRTALERRVEERMQSMLGRVTIEAGPQAYPLSSSLPTSFARHRIALVGEAAHQFPPIGAQGLNLGLRDVADLADVAERHREDPGSEAALSAYDRRRRPDILARTGAVSLLNTSLLSDMLPAQIARSAGLGLLGALPPLRAFFMREGLAPGSGFTALASAARKQVRRQDA
jgi:2-octaprenyl-6-methoxyphenol hydroxylase